MALLNATLQAQVRQALEGLENPVKLVVFSQGEAAPELNLPVGEALPVGAIECQMCTETRQLVEEVAELSDKISMEVYDFVADEEAVQRYKIDKIPAIALVAQGPQGEKDYGIRFYGIPSGYEFSSLIEDLRQVSRPKTDLYEKTLASLQKLDRPVHLQVFVTPT